MLSTSQSRSIRTLLAEDVQSNKQADSEIHEDQLLNFLVNRLDGEVAFGLVNNARIGAEEIYEDFGLYALQLKRELTRSKHDPLPFADEV